MPAFFQFFPNIASHRTQSCMSLCVSGSLILNRSEAYDRMLADVKIGKIISHDKIARFSEYFSRIEHTF